MASKTTKNKPEAYEASSNTTESQTSDGRAIINVKKIRNKDFAEIPIGVPIRLAGVIHRLSGEEGEYGDYIRMKGDFAAVVAHQGEEVIIRSGTLFLPEVAEDIITRALGDLMKDARKPEPGTAEAADKRKKKLATFVLDLRGNGGVEFKMVLRKKADPDPKNAKGWVWTAEDGNQVVRGNDKILALLGP